MFLFYKSIKYEISILINIYYTKVSILPFLTTLRSLQLQNLFFFSLNFCYFCNIFVNFIKFFIGSIIVIDTDSETISKFFDIFFVCIEMLSENNDLSLYIFCCFFYLESFQPL